MKKKKIYYVPGLISLVGIFVLLLLIWPEDPREYTVLRHYLPSDDSLSAGGFSKYSVYKVVGNKKVIKIGLRHLELNVVQVQMERLIPLLSSS